MNDVGLFETRHSSFLHESRGVCTFNGTLRNDCDGENRGTFMLTPKGDGTVTLAGKLGTYSVSGSTTLSFNEIGNGRLSADFVPFVTVGKAKKALSISCSLDLNRNAGASAGSAKLVD